MMWLTWRQFRAQTLVALAALAAIAVTLGITGPHLAHLFHTEIAGCLGQSGSNVCSSDTVNAFTDTDSFLQHLFGYALIVIPGLIGAFWGAPLLSREVEAGTHRLVWNQSVTRTRWLAVKVALIGLTSAVTAGLFSLTLTWWSSPLDRVKANRITPPVFDQRGIDPIGWALFAFALGVTAGVLLRRTLPAMATTLGIFTAARILWPLYLRPHYLIPPVHKTARIGTLPFDWVGVNHGPNSPMVVHVSMPGAWILSDNTVNAAGHQVLGSTLFGLCPVTFSGGATKIPPDSCFIQHLNQLGYNRSVLTYQPASRFWPLQWVETGILTAAAVLLAAFCYWWVRRGKVS
jgi:hypothetical protein